MRVCVIQITYKFNFFHFRKPEILKDRDLSGELKDVWSAVQACRDKGRVESTPPENLVVYTEFGPDSAPSYGSVQQNIVREASQPKPPQSPPPNESIQIQDDKQSAITENSSNDSAKSLMDELQKETENIKLNNQTTTTLPSNEQQPQSTPQQQKEHKNFFPMFRSSKSSSSSGPVVATANTNGSSNSNQSNSTNNSSNGSQTSSEDKKKGLNFFRRNKSTVSQSSPTTVQQTSNQAADNNCQMQIHLDGGVTSGEIIESSSATIAAK